MFGEDNSAWLKTLKVGDRFAVSQHNSWDGSQYRLYTIKHITPSRNRFDAVQDGHEHITKFNQWGRESSKGKSFYASGEMEPITAKVKEANDQRKYINYILTFANHDKLKKMTVDQLKPIYQALAAAEKANAPKTEEGA